MYCLLENKYQLDISNINKDKTILVMNICIVLSLFAFIKDASYVRLRAGPSKKCLYMVGMKK